jgi:hypothetical protein
MKRRPRATAGAVPPPLASSMVSARLGRSVHGVRMVRWPSGVHARWRHYCLLLNRITAGPRVWSAHRGHRCSDVYSRKFVQVRPSWSRRAAWRRCVRPLCRRWAVSVTERGEAHRPRDAFVRRLRYRTRRHLRLAGCGKPALAKAFLDGESALVDAVPAAMESAYLDLEAGNRVSRTCQSDAVTAPRARNYRCAEE